jgi:hypothetical protein
MGGVWSSRGDVGTTHLEPPSRRRSPSTACSETALQKPLRYTTHGERRSLRLRAPSPVLLRASTELPRGSPRPVQPEAQAPGSQSGTQTVSFDEFCGLVLATGARGRRRRRSRRPRRRRGRRARPARWCVRRSEPAGDLGRVEHEPVGGIRARLPRRSPNNSSSPPTPCSSTSTASSTRPPCGADATWSARSSSATTNRGCATTKRERRTADPERAVHCIREPRQRPHPALRNGPNLLTGPTGACRATHRTGAQRTRRRVVRLGR